MFEWLNIENYLTTSRCGEGCHTVVRYTKMYIVQKICDLTMTWPLLHDFDDRFVVFFILIANTCLLNVSVV